MSLRPLPSESVTAMLTATVVAQAANAARIAEGETLRALSMRPHPLGSTSVTCS